jgi:CheY-like chemotaxis protein
LLLFSRRQVVHRQPVNISDSVGNMVPMLRRLLRENIQFTTALAGNIGMVTADPTQLEQVIMNLVVNASDAMPEGGSLTVETQNVELDEIYATDVTPGHYVMLVVSDTGIGMDASTVSKIFEPFFTTKEAGKGTGLGLATTYAVVSQLGGHIRVYSEPGHGTAFKIYLPRETAEEGAGNEEKAPIRSQRSSTASQTILLVEDEDIVRRAIRRTLEQHGYQVLEAADGESGLAAAAAHEGELHAVVTDLMMPGMNGRTFIDLLHAARTGFRVVFMSGYTDETVNQRGLVDSTHTFLQKPFSGGQLAKVLNELMHETFVATR